MRIGYLYVAPRHRWTKWNEFYATIRFYKPFYIFRNVPGVIKWIPGKLLPRRWGFGIFGLIEFGSRG